MPWCVLKTGPLAALFFLACLMDGFMNESLVWLMIQWMNQSAFGIKMQKGQLFCATEFCCSDKWNVTWEVRENAQTHTAPVSQLCVMCSVFFRPMRTTRLRSCVLQRQQCHAPARTCWWGPTLMARWQPTGHQAAWGTTTSMWSLTALMLVSAGVSERSEGVVCLIR